ncbi:MAG: hypothetical protein DMG15_07365 [Acidobacteria bacterium]|nr:MAG: hypothetical protein DMG15_07365 [Acidobacteriota bacterium]
MPGEIEEAQHVHRGEPAGNRLGRIAPPRLGRSCVFYAAAQGDSGQRHPVGLGTDAFEVNQYRPFQTLYWAVTGKMVGGRVVNKHTVSREAALIAHTRNNAYQFFRESDLGSIQPGRFADMVVIDRDYLTIPADQIKDIKPLMTIVGGRVIFDVAKESSP